MCGLMSTAEINCYCCIINNCLVYRTVREVIAYFGGMNAKDARYLCLCVLWL